MKQITFFVRQIFENIFPPELHQLIIFLVLELKYVYVSTGYGKTIMKCGGKTREFGNHIPFSSTHIDQHIDKFFYGSYHTIGLTSSCDVYSWGSACSGQLGLGSWSYVTDPCKVSLLSHIVEVFCGNEHTMALNKNGKLFVFGSNSDYQLGLGTTVNKYMPVEINCLSNVVSGGCGRSFSVALDVNGKLYLWGRINHGNFESVPKLFGVDCVRSVNCGSNHMFVMCADGSIYGFGSNVSGQLGLGHVNRVCEPVRLNLSNIKSIHCGGYFTMALTLDNEVYGWGSNSYGEIGIRSYHVDCKTTKLKLKNIRDIYCGQNHVIAFSFDCILYVWGSNDYNQIGIGPIPMVSEPWRLDNIF